MTTLDATIEANLPRHLALEHRERRGHVGGWRYGFVCGLVCGVLGLGLIQLLLQSVQAAMRG